MEQTFQVFLSYTFASPMTLAQFNNAYARSLMTANTVLYADHSLKNFSKYNEIFKHSLFSLWICYFLFAQVLNAAKGSSTHANNKLLIKLWFETVNR